MHHPPLVHQLANIIFNGDISILEEAAGSVMDSPTPVRTVTCTYSYMYMYMYVQCFSEGSGFFQRNSSDESSENKFLTSQMPVHICSDRQQISEVIIGEGKITPEINWDDPILLRTVHNAGQT